MRRLRVLRMKRLLHGEWPALGMTFHTLVSTASQQHTGALDAEASFEDGEAVAR